MQKKNRILLSHGSGGKLSHELIQNLFVKYFNNEHLEAQTDSSLIKTTNGEISFTTDSYVVDPIFFQGGNIGKLAVCGTVNDLAVSGAIPKYLSCGFIIEEGFEIENLESIVKSMSEEARNAGVEIVTGDTKVVNRGKCDKVFINTAGIGELPPQHRHFGFGNTIQPGDKIIVNGNIGDHGIAILAAREALSFKSDIASDCAPLNDLISKIVGKPENIKFMRDATRGGLATVLCELAESKNLGIEIQEDKIPVNEIVAGACEIFGFDPLYLANEGKIVLIVDGDSANDILETMKKHPLGKQSSIIGTIVETNPKKVLLETAVGGRRILDMLAGEMLPRIC